MAQATEDIPNSPLNIESNKARDRVYFFLTTIMKEIDILNITLDDLQQYESLPIKSKSKVWEQAVQLVVVLRKLENVKTSQELAQLVRDNEDVRKTLSDKKISEEFNLDQGPNDQELEVLSKIRGILETEYPPERKTLTLGRSLPAIAEKVKQYQDQVMLQAFNEINKAEFVVGEVLQIQHMIAAMQKYQGQIPGLVEHYQSVDLINNLIKNINLWLNGPQGIVTLYHDTRLHERINLDQHLRELKNYLNETQIIQNWIKEVELGMRERKWTDFQAFYTHLEESLKTFEQTIGNEEFVKVLLEFKKKKQEDIKSWDQELKRLLNLLKSQKYTTTRMNQTISDIVQILNQRIGDLRKYLTRFLQTLDKKIIDREKAIKSYITKFRKTVKKRVSKRIKSYMNTLNRNRKRILDESNKIKIESNKEILKPCARLLRESSFIEDKEKAQQDAQKLQQSYRELDDSAKLLDKKDFNEFTVARINTKMEEITNLEDKNIETGKKRELIKKELISATIENDSTKKNLVYQVKLNYQNLLRIIQEAEEMFSEDSNIRRRTNVEQHYNSLKKLKSNIIQSPNQNPEEKVA